MVRIRKWLLCTLIALLIVIFNITPVLAVESTASVDRLAAETVFNPLYDGLVEPSPVVSAPRYYASETNAQIESKCISDYDAIVAVLREGMENRSTTIPVYVASKVQLTSSYLNTLFKDALMETDSPTQGDYLRWVWNNYQCENTNAFRSSNLNCYCYKLIYSVSYYTTAQQEAELTTAVNQIVSGFGFTKATTSLEKVTAIYNYMTKNITYDYNNLYNGAYTLKYTAYAALINKTAVCQGYSVLFYRMAEMVGVDTRVVVGTGNGGDHAWNISLLGSKYYYLDSTWDAGISPANYKFFLKGMTDFGDHQVDYNKNYSIDFANRYPMAQSHYNGECLHNYDHACDPSCNRCGAERSVQHNFTPATCTAPVTCSICDATNGNALGHTYSHDCDKTCNRCGDAREVSDHIYNPATCTQKMTCKNCGATEGNPLGHVYDNDCDNTCNRCGDTRTIAGHTYSMATCTQPEICTKCGAVNSNALGHTYDNDCDKTCNRCSTTREVPDHTYNDATCTKAKTCKKCGKTDGKALGHTYNAATCTKAKTCKRCGVTSGKSLGHTYSNDCDKSCNRCSYTRTVPAHTYKAATCTKAKTCTKCGATSGKSLGHSYKTTTTKATLTKNGSVVKKCTKCSHTASKSTISYPKTIKLSTTSYTYNGKTKTPTVTVKDAAGKKLTKNTHYTVTYSSGRKNVGTYKVTIKFKGNYTGTKTLTFKILPKAASINKLTAATKAFTVKLNRSLIQTSGYEVQCSTSKSFTSKKSKWITNNKTSSATVKSLKAKATYYVRVRSYKIVNKVKIYSAWSSVKSIKTK